MNDRMKSPHTLGVASQASRMLGAPPGRFLATLILFLVGSSGLLFLPLWVGALPQLYEVSDAVTGRIASVQLSCIALVSLFFARYASRLHTRAGLLAGLLFIACGGAIAVAVPSVVAFAASRALSGLGEGLILTILYRLLARSPEPDRLVIFCNMFVLLVGVFAYPFLGESKPQIVIETMFTAIAAAGVVALPLCWFLPSSQLGAVSRSATAIDRNGKLAALSIMAFYVGEGGLWAYVVQIGLSKGLSIAEVGQILSTSFLLSVGGPMAAFLFARWLGNRLAFIANTLGLAAVAVVFGFVADPVWFAYACFSFYFLFILAVVHSTTMTINLDSSGNLASVIPGLRTVGMAAGPFLSSFFLIDGDFKAVALLVIAFYIISISCAFLIASKIQEIK